MMKERIRKERQKQQKRKEGEKEKKEINIPEMYFSSLAALKTTSSQSTSLLILVMEGLEGITLREEDSKLKVTMSPTFTDPTCTLSFATSNVVPLALF